MGKNSQLLFDDMTFKELMGQSLKHWRKAVAVGLFVALLLSGFTFLTSYKSLPSNMSEEDRIATETQIANLQGDVELLNEQIAVQQDYIDNSILMNINPNTMISASMVFYVYVEGDDPQIEKNINYAYYAMVYSGEIAECVSKMEGFSSSDYLKEIITAEINVDSEVPCFVVYAKHYDEQKANELLDAIDSVFESKEEELVTTMGDFELKEISRSVSVVASPELVDSQTDAYTSISTLQSALSEKEASLDELTKSVSMSNLIIKTSLLFLIGFVIGFIAVMAVYAVMILASSKVKSANQLRSNYSVRVLGNFYFFDKEIKPLDKLAYRLSDEDAGISAEQVAELVKSNIEISSEGKNVLIISLSQNEKVQTVANLLDDAEKSIVMIKSDFKNPETVKEMKKADVVVVLAGKFENTLYQLDMAKREIEDNKKEFLGVILI